jgi:uncharacterized membrane protein YphA (DoxX/SURF4 family)
MPGWVRATLDAEVTFALARLLLTLPYWCSGLAKLLDPLGAVQECAGLGLPAPGLVVALTIVVQLGGSLLVIANRRLWLGAGALAVFTVAATLAAHAFWRVQGAARLAQMNAFLEHLALIAAFALAAVASRRRRHGAFRAEYLP